jgi:hypothetical protein
VIKLRRLKWAGHVAPIGERRDVSRVLLGNPRVRDHLEDPCVDGRIILRWIFRKWDEGAWTGLIWLRIRKVAGTCQCGKESSGSINAGNFLIIREPVSFSRRAVLHGVSTYVGK